MSVSAVSCPHLLGLSRYVEQMLTTVNICQYVVLRTNAYSDMAHIYIIYIYIYIQHDLSLYILCTYLYTYLDMTYMPMSYTCIHMCIPVTQHNPVNIFVFVFAQSFVVALSGLFGHISVVKVLD